MANLYNNLKKITNLEIVDLLEYVSTDYEEIAESYAIYDDETEILAISLNTNSKLEIYDVIKNEMQCFDNMQETLEQVKNIIKNY